MEAVSDTIIGMNIDELAWTSRWPATFDDLSTSISIAKTRTEIDDIGTLRYSLYIERDHKRYPHADHANRLFLDKVDAVSLNFQARHRGQLLVASRLTWADDAEQDPQLSLLPPPGMSAHERARTILNSRLAALPKLRAKWMIVPLFRELYRHGLLSGAEQCYLATRDDLVPMFTKIGFRKTERIVDDPFAGQLNVLRFDLFDFTSLNRLHSPLMVVASAWLSDRRRKPARKLAGAFSQ
jgi:hypothetical protein